MLLYKRNLELRSIACREMKFDRSAVRSVAPTPFPKSRQPSGRLIYLHLYAPDTVVPASRTSAAIRPDEADQTLRQSTPRRFSDWLALIWNSQKQDLEGYLDDITRRQENHLGHLIVFHRTAASAATRVRSSATCLQPIWKPSWTLRYDYASLPLIQTHSHPLLA